MSCGHNCVHERRARLANKLETNQNIQKSLIEAHKHHDHSDDESRSTSNNGNISDEDNPLNDVDELVSFIEGEKSSQKQKAKKERKKQRLAEKKRIEEEAIIAKEQLRKLNEEKVKVETTSQLSKKQIKKANQKTKQPGMQGSLQDISNRDSTIVHEHLNRKDIVYTPGSAVENNNPSMNRLSISNDNIQYLGKRDPQLEIEQLKLKHAQEMEVLKLQHRQALEEEQMRKTHQESKLSFSQNVLTQNVLLKRPDISKISIADTESKVAKQQGAKEGKNKKDNKKNLTTNVDNNLRSNIIDSTKKSQEKIKDNATSSKKKTMPHKVIHAEANTNIPKDSENYLYDKFVAGTAIEQSILNAAKSNCRASQATMPNDVPLKKSQKIASKSKNISSNKVANGKDKNNSEFSHHGDFAGFGKGFLINTDKSNDAASKDLIPKNVQVKNSQPQPKTSKSKNKTDSLSEKLPLKSPVSSKSISNPSERSQITDSLQLKNLKAHLDKINKMPATNRTVSNDCGARKKVLTNVTENENSIFPLNKNSVPSLEDLNMQLDQLTGMNVDITKQDSATRQAANNAVHDQMANSFQNRASKPLTGEEREKLKAEILSGKNNPRDSIASLDALKSKLANMSPSASLGSIGSYSNDMKFGQNTSSDFFSPNDLNSLSSLDALKSKLYNGQLNSNFMGSNESKESFGVLGSMESLGSALGGSALGSMNSLSSAINGIDLNSYGMNKTSNPLSSMSAVNSNGTQKSKICMQKITRKDGTIWYSCSRCHIRSEDAAKIIAHKNENMCDDRYNTAMI